METNIFDKFVSQKTLFKNKEHLRHNYRPANLPHRQEEIEKISYNLWEALTGHIPSNMTLYGVTGAGKTAVTDYVCHHLRAKGNTMSVRSLGFSSIVPIIMIVFPSPISSAMIPPLTPMW